MTIKATFYQNDFSAKPKDPRLRFVVNSFTWHADGGPISADIAAGGDDRDLWSLFKQLRAPIVLVDDDATSCWWGFANGIELNLGGVVLAASLDSMNNRIKVAYTYTPAGDTRTSERGTTDWAQYDATVDHYGKRELLASIGEATADYAESYRDRRLEKLKRPRSSTTHAGQSPVRSGQLTCRGWWDTLDWEYHSEDAGFESFSGTDPLNVTDVGRTASREKVAQSWALPGGADNFYLDKISIQVWTAGSPADNVQLGLYTDVAGLPGVLIESVSLAASSLPSEPGEWVEFQFTTLPTTTAGTTYWLVVERSGAIDASNYYKLGVDYSLGYSRGEEYIWNGSTWVKNSPDFDALFRVAGVWETTEIINQAVSAAQFFNGVTITDASGEYDSPYRNGDNTILYVVQELLDGGNSSDGRILAQVTEGRYLRVFNEPSEPSGSEGFSYFLLPDGKLVDKNGQPIPARTPPVGEWYRMRDIATADIDRTLIELPDTGLIERATYDCAGEYWRIETEEGMASWGLESIVEG